MKRQSHRGELIASGTLLGAGLGGFIDGIVFHQILQWHNMLSSKIPPTTLVTMKYNMVWDGLFHTFTWLMTVSGLLLLWRSGQRTEAPRSSRTFGGALLLGWGLFNVIEGLLNHQIFGIHHVHPGSNQLAWDIAFLAFGALLVVLAWQLIGSAGPNSSPRSVVWSGRTESELRDE